MHTLTTADKVAMYVGGGLVLLGTFALGLIEMLLGTGHPIPTGDQIIHEPLISGDIRAAIILVGLLIWGLYAVYKLVATTPTTPDAA